jgi:hypothetical protein
VANLDTKNWFCSEGHRLWVTECITPDHKRFLEMECPICGEQHTIYTGESVDG